MHEVGVGQLVEVLFAYILNARLSAYMLVIQFDVVVFGVQYNEVDMIIVPDDADVVWAQGLVGGKLVPIMQAYFLAKAAIAASKAPKGKKLATFMDMIQHW